MAGDLIYILGITKNELGASEYYQSFNEVGLNLPEVNIDQFKQIYKILEKAIDSEIIESCHAVARGGLAVHFALTALSCELGIELDLAKIPTSDEKGILRDDRILFSESAGRFIITIAPENQSIFEKLFKGLPCSYAGSVTDKHMRLIINGCEGNKITEIAIDKLETAFTEKFGDMI